jgi:magnesium chelatase family protein
MSIKVTSIGLKGIEGYQVNVEVKALGGVESIVIVGLPDASVKESKDRITAALHSMGISIADQKLLSAFPRLSKRKMVLCLI